MKRYYLSLVTFFIPFIVKGQSHNIEVESLFQFKEVQIAPMNTIMKNKKWVFLKNYMDTLNNREYVLWGKRNKGNSYCSETLMIGFKKNEKNIITYATSDSVFCKRGIQSIRNMGYAKLFDDENKDAYAIVYGKNENRVGVVIKPMYKERIYFTMYTFTICNKAQMNNGMYLSR